jgi:hypothetical protein
MKLHITTLLFLCIVCCATKAYSQTNIEEFTIALEDSLLEEVTVLFEGPNGTPHDIVVVDPGRWAIDLDDLPPDNYNIIIYSDGYAEQRLRITFREGKFVTATDIPNKTLTLYLKRYTTMEIVWSEDRNLDLTSEHVDRQEFTTSYLGWHPILWNDWTLHQTITEENDGYRKVSMTSGPNLVLRKHRHQSFFGVAHPNEGESFEAATLAPTNDAYTNARMVDLEPNRWFYLRITGRERGKIFYAKVKVKEIGLSPNGYIKALPERTEPVW